MTSFRRECCLFVALYLAVFEWKVQKFCWPKGTSLECAESIYVKTTSGHSRIKRVVDRLATLSIPTVRVEALE